MPLNLVDVRASLFRLISDNAGGEVVRMAGVPGSDAGLPAFALVTLAQYDVAICRRSAPHAGRGICRVTVVRDAEANLHAAWRTIEQLVSTLTRKTFSVMNWDSGEGSTEVGTGLIFEPRIVEIGPVEGREVTQVDLPFEVQQI